jgi:hypothetical protein
MIIIITTTTIISNSTNSILKSLKSGTSTRAVAAAEKNRPASPGLK